MIVAKNLSMEFNGNLLFEEAEFAINEGEKIGLIGRNGTGKSTLFKLILKQLEPNEGGITIDEWCKVGHLEQHIKFSKSSVIEEVCSVLELEREHEGWKGEKILIGLGFSEEQMLEDPLSLSGGYQVKVNLAKILLMETDIILLDEPTNYLDIYSIRWLGSFLRKWKGSLVLITHDRHFMDSIITHTIMIHRHKMRKISGKTDKIREQIAIEEDIYEKTRVNEEKKRAQTQQLIDRFRAKASKAAMAQSRIKMLEKQDRKEKLVSISNLDFNFNHFPFTGTKELIKVKDLSFGYEKDNLLIKDLNFLVGKNDKICIVGKNGIGKSTILKLLTGDLESAPDAIDLHNKVQMGYFGQTNIDRLDPSLTICQEMETSNADAEYNLVRKTCSAMLFSGDLAHKKISVLSGGEKSRVMLGKILLSPVSILILDEPTNHLDMESSESLLEAIKSFPGAVIMVTHDEHFIHNVAERLIVFDDGKTTLFDGNYATFLKKVGWKK